jgi:AraC-like DNA-binding protein
MPVIDVVLRNPSHSIVNRQHFMIAAPVRRGTVTSFRFPRSFLSARSNARAGENVHWEVARLWLDHTLGTATGGRSMNLIDGVGFKKLKDIAEQLDVSRATMRRRLRSTDGGYRDARERALVEAASSRLLATADSVEAISAELGYADARNFRRFFKNATGLTPQQIRLRARCEAPDREKSLLEKLVTTSARFSQHA